MVREKVKAVKAGNPKIAVALVRVSTEDQDHGPLAQRDAIERWAAREGVAVIATFEERVSGGADWSNRAGLLDALAALAEHGAGILVVARLDRLARSVINAAIIEQRVHDAGARVVSAGGEPDGDDATSKLLRTITAAIAEWERLMIATRTRAALQAMKARGLRTGNVPYGKSAGNDGRLVDNDGEAAAVTLAAQLHGEGLSLRAIGFRLAEAGYLSRAGTVYHATQVRRMVGGR